MSLLIKGIDIPKDVHGETVLDNIRLIFSNANTRFSIPLNKDDIIEIHSSQGRLVEGRLVEEFEKNLERYIDPYEIPGAMQALYDAMEDFDLVRCDECMYWDKAVNIDDHLCRRTMRWTLNTDYCSDGEWSVL